MADVTPGDIFRNNPQLAKQFAAAAANQAGPGFGNFMGAAMGVPQMPQMPQMPQQAFFQESPPVQRREMRGPSGVDDILKTFQEVREMDSPVSPMGSPMGSSMPIFSQQPAVQAVSELASNYSDDTQSQVESVRSVPTGQRRGRRKAMALAENTMTLNL